MLETALVTTIGLPGGGSSNCPQSNGDTWESGDPGKFSAIKLECPDSFDTMMLSQSSTDLAELKPLPFDYGDEGALEPLVLTENNNISSSKDLNLRSPFYSPPDVSSTMVTPPPPPSSSILSRSSPREGLSTASSSPLSSSSSGGTNSIKLELDFTASQDAFDDLASIVGISMGADSTVPSLDSSDIAAQEWSDLDAWIENTAQEIKPLEATSSSSHNNPSESRNNFIIGSTLHSLLTANGPSKMTQLQQREVLQQATQGATTTILPPPPYSILQNRLQHGADGIGSSFYTSGGDSLPHSTSPLIMQEDQLLRRSISLGEIKAKKSSSSSNAAKSLGRSKLNSTCSSSNSSTSSTSSSSSSPNPSSLDPSKKMMHHCHICNRGFLNKSNIKVHLRTHTGEKPFKCEHCSKAFRQKAHLLKHMSIHKRISRD